MADNPRAARLRFAIPLVLFLVGIALVVVGGDVNDIIGAGVMAVAVTIAISLAFLEVGYSEDRERAREEARRRGGSA